MVLELQRGYLYQNGVEFRQKVFGAGLNLFQGHLHHSSGASAPVAERTILLIWCLRNNWREVKRKRWQDFWPGPLKSQSHSRFCPNKETGEYHLVQDHSTSSNFKIIHTCIFAVDWFTIVNSTHAHFYLPCIILYFLWQESGLSQEDADQANSVMSCNIYIDTVGNTSSPRYDSN